MKKIRKALSALLCLTLLVGFFPSIEASEQFFVDAEAFGLCDGQQLLCSASLRNSGEKSGKVTVYKAVYNKAGEEIRTESESVELEAGMTSAKIYSFTVKYNGAAEEYAKMYFWKEKTLEPVCEAVSSRECPEGEIGENKIEITEADVFASGESEYDNRATNIADGNLETYWSARDVTEHEPRSVTAVLKHEYMITRVGAAFGLGSERGYIFEISVSKDGKIFSTVLDAQTSAKTDEMQYFNVPPCEAKFVRLTVLGREIPDNDNWVRVSEIELYGSLIPYDEGEEVARYDFSDDAGTRLTENASSTEDGFVVRAMTEETYKDYTPSLGEKLYAEVNNLPPEAGKGVSSTALYIHDSVGRETNTKNGAGGIMAAKQYPTAPDRGKYNISFEMFLPKATSSGDNDPYWSGFSLTDELLTGGADISKYAAVQVRFEKKDGKAQVKYLISNQFNEGSLIDFMDTSFEFGKLWEVSLDVDPTARRCDITISDGVNSETRPMYFTYNDFERARISTWSGLEAKWLIFNSGAGSKSDMYVDNISVKHLPEEETQAPETVIADIDMTEGNDGSVGYANISDNQGDYVGSLGKKLYGEVTTAPAKSGIETGALHLYDAVGRVTDAVNGAGAVAGYIDLPYTENDNAYKIEFKMYAPVADSYGGFSLSHGRNAGDNNTNTPMALQMRFSPQNAGMQLNRYNSIGFNNGNWEAVVGSYTPIDMSKPIDIEIVVNPTKLSFDITVDDGVNRQTRTKEYATKNTNNQYEYWMTNKIDTLMINTGMGGNGDIYVGNIKVTDLGERRNTLSALHGILRLGATHGTGAFVHHNGAEYVDVAEKQDPNYTRFVERSGLMDSDGVSFEVMNRPGYYLTVVAGTDNVVQVQKFTNTARFKANATFYKESAVNTGRYTGTTVSYRSYRDPSRFLYEDNGKLTVWKMYARSNCVFYQRSEAQTVISDNFKGTSLKSQWRANYPWDSGNLGHHNTTGIARSSNVVVGNGECLLKATWIDPNNWNAKDEDGNTGIDYEHNYNFGKPWTKYSGYVGVISSNWDTLFWRESYMEGSFKQPDCAGGYWNAFWLSPQEGWPPETDIFEYLSSKGADTWYTCIHGGSYGNDDSEGGWHKISPGTLRTQYHTYALDWGYDYMDFYFDGQFYARYTDYRVDHQNRNGMRIIINTGLGGWEEEPSSKTVWDTGLRIAWFRSFQY